MLRFTRFFGVNFQYLSISLFSPFSLHFLILFPFPHSLSISSFSVHFLSISSFSLHFLIFSPFSLHFLFISSFSFHFLAARLQGCNDSCSPGPQLNTMERGSLCLGFRVLSRTLIRQFEWQGFTLNSKVSFPNVTNLRGVWRGLQQFTFAFCIFGSCW